MPQRRLSDTLPNHFGWIDGLRGVAALAVVIFHYHHFYLADAADRPNLPPTEIFPWSSVINLLYTDGSSAVELFWVISGFVFAHVYFQRKTTLREFWLARFARLYPLHFATLVFVACLQILSMRALDHWQIYSNNDLRHFGLQLIFASNWTTLSRGLSFNGPVWSVSLEILAYGIFFVTLPLLRQLKLFGALFLAAAMWAMGLQSSLDIPAISKLAFICAGYFFLGTATYSCLQKIRGNSLHAILFCSTGLLCWTAGSWIGNAEIMQASASVIAVFCVALIDVKWQKPTHWILKRLGDMSYSIYLVHVPMQMCVLLVMDLGFDGTRAFAASPLTLIVYLCATVFVADLTYRHFEVPAAKLIRGTLNSQKPRKQ